MLIRELWRKIIKVSATLMWDRVEDKEEEKEEKYLTVNVFISYLFI